MEAIIKLYKNCQIIPEKYFKVDNIDTYLTTLSDTITISKFQYIKHNIDVEIKIDKPQTFLNRVQANAYNYCTIQNGSEEIVYYYVMSKKWTSENTIKFVLKMDTINTYLDKYSFSAKTKILREHKDRWKLKTPHTLGQDYYLIPKIDFYSEGINPVLYKSFEYEIKENTNNVEWYLVYMNSESIDDEELTERPIECYLFSSPSTNISAYSEFKTITLATEHSNNNNHFAIWYGDNGAITLTITEEQEGYPSSTSTYTLGNTYNIDGVDYILKGVAFDYINNAWRFELCCWEVGNHNIVEKEVQATSGYSFTTISGALGIARKYPNSQYYETYPVYQNDMTNIYKVGRSHASISTRDISELDRTNSKIVKVIKIPYCPSTFLTSSYTLTDKWIPNYEQLPDTSVSIYGQLRLRNTTEALQNEFNGIVDASPFLAVANRNVGDGSDFNLTNNRFIGVGKTTYETKLFHSDYYQPRVIYDSFVKQFQLELFYGDEYKMSQASQYFTIKFTMTSTCNSRFMFTFEKYKPVYSTENFENVLIVRRNNELALYNNAYIDYVRTGINYDQKTNLTSGLRAWGGTFFNTISSIAGYEEGNGASLIIGMGKNIFSSVLTSVQNEWNIEQKQLQAQYTTESVNGSDDVDLMSIYAKNRLLYSLYKPSERMTRLLDDLFYYTGYTANYTGIPNTTSRMWFNYIQCEAVFTQNDYNIPQEIEDDVKQNLRIGITYLHKSPYGNTWDFEQEKENWESAVYNNL